MVGGFRLTWTESAEDGANKDKSDDKIKRTGCSHLLNDGPANDTVELACVERRIARHEALKRYPLQLP